jgi:anti-sigma-K factor RskA
MIEQGHIDDLVEARALDALPLDEQLRVDQHVETCPTCKHLLAEMTETAHLLAWIVQPERPSRHCKSRIMERIERETFLARPAAGRPARSRPVWAGWLAVGALALLLVGWNVRLQQENNKLQVVEAAVVSDRQPATLKPQKANLTHATGWMYVHPDGQDAFLVVQNLAPAPAGKIYQIWIANDSGKRRMQTFQATHTVEQLMMHSNEPLIDFKWIMITIEDEGGDQAEPSDDTVLLGNL